MQEKSTEKSMKNKKYIRAFILLNDMKKTPELFDQWNEQKKRIEFGTKNTIDFDF